MDMNKKILQGIYMAPSVVASSLKTNIFAGCLSLSVLPNITNLKEDDNNTYLYFYVDNKAGEKTLSIKKLLINDKLYEIAEEHCQNLCKNGTSGNIAQDDILTKKIMEEQKISPNEWAECIIFGINNPISIVNFLIVDKYSKKKKYRNILLNEQFSQIGISLNKHISYGFCCIIIFSTSKIVHQKSL